MATERRDSAAAGQARSLARRLLLADGVVVFLAGLVVVGFASWLGGAFVVIRPHLLVVVGALLIVYGAALALLAGRAPVSRRLLVTVVIVNVVWAVAVGLLLGVAGGQMPERGRWLLTAAAVAAGTFAALEWMIPRRFLP